jgi:hypothetical protein
MSKKARRTIIMSPQWSSRGRSLTARRRGLLNVTVGTGGGCPHSVRVTEVVGDPLDHEDVRPHRSFLRRTDSPCVHGAGHADDHDNGSGTTWS